MNKWEGLNGEYKRHRNKSFYDYRGFTGPDVDIETSLRVYGLIWKEVKRDEYLFIYGLPTKMTDDCEYTRFTYAYMHKSTIRAILESSWFDRQAFLDYIGLNEEALSDAGPAIVHDMVAYYGSLEIFGDCYDEGFTIGK